MDLNLGSGDYPAAGWVNVDLSHPTADVHASLTALPFPDQSSEHVYAGHVLEHIWLHDLPTVLAEIRRVLSGTLMVVGPCLTRAVRGYPDAVPDIIAGAGRWEGDDHRWPSRETTTLRHLTAAGFTCTPLPITDVPAPWPVVSRIGWQLAIEARKDPAWNCGGRPSATPTPSTAAGAAPTAPETCSSAPAAT